MKAAIYYGPGDLRVKDLPLPAAGKMGVVVRVKACGICPVIDLNQWQKMAKGNVGNAIGHEWIGEVVEVGPDAAHLVKKGTRCILLTRLCRAIIVPSVCRVTTGGVKTGPTEQASTVLSRNIWEYRLLLPKVISNRPKV